MSATLFLYTVAVAICFNQDRTKVSGPVQEGNIKCQLYIINLR